MLVITGNGGDAMGSRFLPFRPARQFRTDVRTLFCRRLRGGPSISDRALALDRIAGSIFLLGLVPFFLWFASLAAPEQVKVPAVAESAQAAPDAPDLEVQQRVVEAAAQPLTTNDIRKLQNRLAMLGFDPGPIDGVAGPRTLNAFNQYRASKDLRPVSKIHRANAAKLLN